MSCYYYHDLLKSGIIQQRRMDELIYELTKKVEKK